MNRTDHKSQTGTNSRIGSFKYIFTMNLVQLLLTEMELLLFLKFNLILFFPTETDHFLHVRPLKVTRGIKGDGPFVLHAGVSQLYC